MIFCGGAYHRRAANIDVLNGVVKGHTGLRDRGRKWVQVHHHHVDRRDVVLLHRRFMVRKITPRQDAAVYFRVKRLDPAIHHFWKASVLADLNDVNAVVAQ